MASRMIEKTTTAAALRLAFSDLLSGLYSQEEMDQAGFTPPNAAPDAAAAAEQLAKTTNGVVAPGGSAGAAAEQALKTQQPSTTQSAADPSDLQQPTALEQIRSTPEADPGADLLPDRSDMAGAVGALYKKAQAVGLTRQGWHTMTQILGGDPIDPSKAMAAIKGLADASKVNALNAGKTPQAA